MEVLKVGGSVFYGWQHVNDAGWRPNQQPLGPAWARSWLGDDFFATVSYVSFNSQPVTDAALDHIKAFSQLNQLWLFDANITDSGLQRLQSLSQLEQLGLGNTKVTDAGLVHLEALKQLRVLGLNDTGITDIGLAHLQGLSRLQELCLIPIPLK